MFNQQHITNNELKINNFLADPIERDFIFSTPALLEPEDNRFAYFFKMDFRVSNAIVYFEKDDFTLLQLLGDVTALYEGLFLLGTAFLFGCLQLKQKRENYLLSTVFRQTAQLKKVKIYFHQSMWHLFCCRSESKRVRKIMLARVSKELDVVRFVRN